MATTLRPLPPEGQLTGIFKTPVDVPVAVGSEGLAGDRQGDRRVHGGPDKAVYAYASEDTAWWETELGREVADRVPAGQRRERVGVERDGLGLPGGKNPEIGKSPLQTRR